MRIRTHLAVAVVGLAVVLPASRSVRADSPSAGAGSYTMDVPLEYYNLAFALSKRTGGITPPVQGRIFAYMGLALYESVVDGMPHRRSIASSLRGIGPLPRNHGTKFWPLVASAAMAEVMRGLWGDATNVAAQNIADIDALERRLEDRFDLRGSLARRSVDFGRAVGAAVYQTSRDDGEDRSYLTNFQASYIPPVCDGCWVPTTPTQIAMQPFWKNEMTPFVLTSGDCGEDGPPDFSTDPSSQAYQEAREVYLVRNTLTPEQAVIARFWADGPGTINGPGHSLSTTGQILQLMHANLAEAAETYARVGLAVGDGVYAVWWSKYNYNWLRPVTYINRYIDPAWTTLLPTPPFPEYTSAHSGQTSAAIHTLIALWGDVGYTDHTHDADGFAPRTFASLSESMNETAVSRMYAGIHYRSAISEGIDQGRCAARQVAALPWRQRQRGAEIPTSTRHRTRYHNEVVRGQQGSSETLLPRADRAGIERQSVRDVIRLHDVHVMPQDTTAPRHTISVSDDRGYRSLRIARYSATAAFCAGKSCSGSSVPANSAYSLTVFQALRSGLVHEAKRPREMSAAARPGLMPIAYRLRLSSAISSR